jgi:hypothetical protein
MSPIGSIGKDIVDVLERPKNPEASTYYVTHMFFLLDPQKGATHEIGSTDLDLTFQVDVQELLLASEPALSAIWMTPEEDEAWKDL